MQMFEIKNSYHLYLDSLLFDAKKAAPASPEILPAHSVISIFFNESL
jgi:hypothetical protein